MSQKVTVTNTTTPVTVMCSNASSITKTATIAPTTVSLAGLGQHDVNLTPLLIPGAQ